ncbi:MAG TPA: GAF domain-containing sensor histidine kinase [Actinomycetota bacterium]|nr:GAF domain-containing sensor histidine kinase [Actinomycetota bacterium]
MADRAQRQAAGLVEAGLALASEHDLDALLQRIADLARELVGAQYAAVGVIGEKTLLRRFVHSGIDVTTAHEIGDLPQGRGLLGALLEGGRPMRLREISEHHASYGFPPHHPPMHSFLGVPIVVREKVYGRLYLTEKRGDSQFSKDDERLALTLAAQAGVAIQNANLLEEIKARSEDLAVLEERDRISKELHDGVIQSIYSVGLALQGAMTIVERDPKETMKRMDEAIGTLDNVVRDVRSYIFGLQPKSVEEYGLKRAIEELLKDLEVNALVEVTEELSEAALQKVSSDASGDLIQIVREILSNIARHAHASEVHIACVMREDETFVMKIEDNGRHFDPRTVARGDGLNNIQGRARRIGGAIAISARSPKGTMHTISLPTGSR